MRLSRFTLIALALQIGCGLSASPAWAGYTVTLQQVGSNVIATGSGAIDLTGLTRRFLALESPLLNPSAPGIITGDPRVGVGTEFMGTISGPANFGSGGLIYADSGTGDFAGVSLSASLDVVIVPGDYTNDTFLSDSATYVNATFSGLGVTPGTYEWTWGTGPDQNFTLQVGSQCLQIMSPEDSQDFNLGSMQHNQVDIAFQAATETQQSIDWTVTLTYQTSGGRGPFTDIRTFSTDSNSEHDETYTGMGGQLAVQATSDSCPEGMQMTTNTITGAAISREEITARLVALYSTGATPRLLTGIAQVESSYRQFSRGVLYGRTDLWPTESHDGGSHIGLMQVPVSMQNAWDWLVNTQAGVDLFNAKLAAAQRITNRIIAQHSGLRQLTPVEIENMALVLYGPYASADLAKQYYVPDCSTSPCGWIVNTAGNPRGVAYADRVRSSMH